jgi:inner membrane transporter RhtA
LLPATATVIGVIVLAQFPTVRDLIGIGLIVAAVAIHRDRATADAEAQTATAEPPQPRQPVIVSAGPRNAA